MAKSTARWGREMARRRYAPGGAIPFVSWDERPWGIKDASRSLREQDVGGGTGGHPSNNELSKLKLKQEMNDYIPKRTEGKT